MLFLRSWLQDYIDGDIPSADELAERLGVHSFEVEGVEEHGDDHVLDIDILPNRAHDCLSYLGMAGEVALIFGQESNLKFKMVEMEVETGGDKTADHVRLEVENSDLVRRATKRLISNVKVGPSPVWLKEKLEAMGQQSINNIVDATNYVMFEFGQPIHAFDLDKLAKKDGIAHVNIRGARKGEKITMLDGKEFELEEGMLVIADLEKALDIAGIKGGIVSGIDENTKNIMVSVCNFEPTNIRKTSKKLGLRTDASTRFEKDISEGLAIEAMKRVSKVIKELAGADVAEDILDVYPKVRKPYKVGVSLERTNKLLGTDIRDKEFANILDGHGFEYERVSPVEKVLKDAPNYLGKPYVYGASISFDAPESFDCSSYVAYLYAQAGVAIPRTSVDQYVFGTPVEDKDARPGDLIFINTGKGNIWRDTQVYMKGTPVPEGVDHVVLYLGDGEIMHATKSLGGVVKEKLSDYKHKNNIVGYRRMYDGPERYVVTAPFFRLDLRIEEDLIEEVGRVYGYANIPEEESPDGGELSINKEFYWISKIRDILINEGFSEVYNYSFVKNGEVEVANALSEEKGYLRSGLEGGLSRSEEIGNKNAPLFGLDKVKVFELGTVFKKDREYIELVTSEDISPILSDKLGEKVSGKVTDISKLIEKLPDPKGYDDLENVGFGNQKFEEFSSYPFVLRDIAVWIPNDRNPSALLKIIKAEGGDLFVRANLFDTYKKDDRTSYAYRIVFQSHDKTLTDDEVNKIMEKIYSEIKKNKGWEVR